MKDEGKGLKALPTLTLCHPQGLSLAICAGDGAAQDKEILLPIPPRLASKGNSLQKGSIGASHTICSKDNYSQTRSEARSTAGHDYKPVQACTMLLFWAVFGENSISSHLPHDNLEKEVSFLPKYVIVWVCLNKMAWAMKGIKLVTPLSFE